MKNSTVTVACACIALVLTASGCASGGMFTGENRTDVQLQQNNFKIVARGVSGESQVGYLFGASMSMGMTSAGFALVRIEGTGMLYKEAIDNLWQNYETVHGPVEGKKLALANIHYDADALNLIVYTRTKVSIRADVVEFTE